MNVSEFVWTLTQRAAKIAWKAYPSLNGQSFVPAHDKFAVRVGDDLVVIEKLPHRNDAYRLTVECGGDRRPLKLVVDSDSSFMLEDLFTIARGCTWDDVGESKMQEIIDRIDARLGMGRYDSLRACRKTEWCSVPLQPGKAEHDGPCDISGHRDNE